MNKINVLVVGSGGREHCLVWKLAQSEMVDKIYCAPGNGGTTLIAENVDIKVDEIEKLADFVQNNNIGLTVVGPEAPLVEGVVDYFQSRGLKIFGPTKELAQFEGSKVFTKEILNKYNIPTAEYKVFYQADSAHEYIKEKGVPIVIKADGLAAGKGVIVANTVEEATGAVDLIMVDKVFGASGNRIVIEECLSGEEASILAITDGDEVIPLIASQDHKRIFDNDKGPNTGGMGAYAPAPLVDEKMLNKIMDTVFKPLIKGLKDEGKPYKGVLYAGLMIKDSTPYVLEFNIRFGDPETQAILPLLKTDLLDVMLKTVDSNLSGIKLEWEEGFCLTVVLASQGYPGKYEKCKKITGLDLEHEQGVTVFHAGTMKSFAQDEGKDVFLTTGGRVLNVTAKAKDIEKAQEKVYKAVEKINFEGMQYRKDIGNKALKFFV